MNAAIDRCERCSCGAHLCFFFFYALFIRDNGRQGMVAWALSGGWEWKVERGARQLKSAACGRFLFLKISLCVL